MGEIDTGHSIALNKNDDGMGEEDDYDANIYSQKKTQ